MNENITKILVYEIIKFSKGIDLIVEAILLNKKGSDIVNYLFTDSSVVDKYCFEHSLDEEAQMLSNFAERFSEVIKSKVIYKPMPEQTEDMIELSLKGFNNSSEALQRIVKIASYNVEIMNVLINYDKDKYNPFSKYGIVLLRDKFEDMRYCYCDELTKKLGI